MVGGLTEHVDMHDSTAETRIGPGDSSGSGNAVFMTTLM